MRGGRRFAPTLRASVLTLLVCLLFVRLGFWQWHRGGERQAAWASFARGADAVQPAGAQTLAALPLYQRVSLTGTLDAGHQFLLDNRSMRGRPGYEVLTPLDRAAGGTVLIDRGWVPFGGSRRVLPEVALAVSAPLTLSGRVANLPSPGLAAGRAAPDPHAPWPKVTSFPRPDELAQALGRPLEARIVLLDPSAPLGYAREWQPPGIAPLRHFSYAIQWWCFALVALVVWAALSRRPLP